MATQNYIVPFCGTHKLFKHARSLSFSLSLSFVLFERVRATRDSGFERKYLDSTNSVSDPFLARATPLDLKNETCTRKRTQWMKKERREEQSRLFSKRAFVFSRARVQLAGLSMACFGYL